MCNKTRKETTPLNIVLMRRKFCIKEVSKFFSKLADIQINFGYCLVGVGNIIHPLFLVWAAISFHDTHVNFGGT